jgi:hypothetical protein
MTKTFDRKQDLEASAQYALQRARMELDMAAMRRAGVEFSDLVRGKNTYSARVGGLTDHVARAVRVALCRHPLRANHSV